MMFLDRVVTARAVALTLVFAIGSIAMSGQGRQAPTRTEVAPGIYMFATRPYGDVGLDGNSIAVLSNDGVLVFDTNGTPAAAAAILAQIRTLTNQPVRYVVNSHWHWDHWYGTEVYTDAFPGLHVITQEKNREMMRGPAIEFNRPGVERDLPRYVTAIEQRAATDPALRARADEDRFFLEQKLHARLVIPDLTFSDRLSIHMGEREIQILHYGRGVTPGDTFAYLPREKVLLLGDLIVNPITFALSGYPSEWERVLERIEQLDANVIVTGHGAPLHDKALLQTTIDIFRILLREGKAAKARGVSTDEARDAMMPMLREPMLRLTHDDARLNADFKTQMVDWFLHRVYEEVDGPLTDAIAPIPKS
jgi:cyclase